MGGVSSRIYLSWTRHLVLKSVGKGWSSHHHVRMDGFGWSVLITPHRLHDLSPPANHSHIQSSLLIFSSIVTWFSSSDVMIILIKDRSWSLLPDAITGCCINYALWGRFRFRLPIITHKEFTRLWGNYFGPLGQTLPILGLLIRDVCYKKKRENVGILTKTGGGSTQIPLLL